MELVRAILRHGPSALNENGAQKRVEKAWSNANAPSRMRLIATSSMEYSLLNRTADVANMATTFDAPGAVSA